MPERRLPLPERTAVPFVFLAVWLGGALPSGAASRAAENHHPRAPAVSEPGAAGRGVHLGPPRKGSS